MGNEEQTASEFAADHAKIVNEIGRVLTLV